MFDLKDCVKGYLKKFTHNIEREREREREREKERTGAQIGIFWGRESVQTIGQSFESF